MESELGHFIHAMRRNSDITYIVMDNQTYGLTTGQASPTSQKRFVTKSSHWVQLKSQSIRLRLLWLQEHVVSRGFSGESKTLTELIENADKTQRIFAGGCFQSLRHLEQVDTYDYFRQKCYKLNGPDYNTSNHGAGDCKVKRMGPKDSTRAFYETQKPTYEEQNPL